ncbi:hypothetical protein [Silvanigrella sp.]|jgi:hypothetical protein|uniref:hypothetical protein n=1 Tax=Silvanigrella sp. TaxID=2024976 RepID=UPI0037C5E0EA
MNEFLSKKNYERLKKFHRVKSLKDILNIEFSSRIFEDETINKIKENINNYKKREQIRLNKIDILTKLLEKIDLKIHQKKNS